MQQHKKLNLSKILSIHKKQTILVQFKNSEKIMEIKGLSQAVEISLGNQKMLILSGQIPFNSKGELVGYDVKTQTIQIFENIKAILENSGATMSEIVKLGIFITDISQIAEYREARDQFINLDTPPTSSLLEVKGLFRKDIFIEIEVTAII